MTRATELAADIVDALENMHPDVHEMWDWKKAIDKTAMGEHKAYVFEEQDNIPKLNIGHELGIMLRIVKARLGEATEKVSGLEGVLKVKCLDDIELSSLQEHGCEFNKLHPYQALPIAMGMLCKWMDGADDEGGVTLRELGRMRRKNNVSEEVHD